MGVLNVAAAATAAGAASPSTKCNTSSSVTPAGSPPIQMTVFPNSLFVSDATGVCRRQRCVWVMSQTWTPCVTPAGCRHVQLTPVPTFFLSLTPQEFAGANIVFGDVTNLDSLRKTAFNGPVDVVVSCLASRTGGKKDSWDIDYQVGPFCCCISYSLQEQAPQLAAAVPQLAAACSTARSSMTHSSQQHDPQLAAACTTACDLDS